MASIWTTLLWLLNLRPSGAKKRLRLDAELVFADSNSTRHLAAVSCTPVSSRTCCRNASLACSTVSSSAHSSTSSSA